MSHQSNYRKALRYLYSLTDYEKRGFAAYAPEHYNLARMDRLLALLGDPLQAFRAVHVAGTKGKGSTAAMIDAVLRAAGYRTGLYTSPHLHTFRERIQVQGDMIPEADVLRLINKIQPLADRIPAITTFEVMTGLAFAWFAEQGIDWAVLEVGLGGRLDATNVVTPAVSVITSISLDHVVILGDTLAQIAAEKAGIVKPGVPVVSAPQRAEALDVIRDTCRRLGAPLTLVGDDWNWQAGAADLDGQHFSLHGEGQILDGLWIPLLGDYQLANAATAVATIQRLREAGADISDAALRRGLQTVHWPGRLEILARAPFVVADSAHNGDSARKLREALETYLDFRELIVILGASADHVTPELLQALLSGAGRAIATQARHPRAASPDWLQSQAAEAGFQMELSDTVPQALDLALSGAHARDLILCTGSVFVAAEARGAWFARQGLPLPPVDPF
ncbi:MAG: folylpolyglutamate synthase/dihydrofolate synthase family protein [Anaerolineae bacterium]|jgi:dihydrofolate synthase/folylpolyglutamate synthase